MFSFFLCQLEFLLKLEKVVLEFKRGFSLWTEMLLIMFFLSVHRKVRTCSEGSCFQVMALTMLTVDGQLMS